MQSCQLFPEQIIPTVIYMETGPEIKPFRNESGVPNFSDTLLAQVFRRLVLMPTANTSPTCCWG